MPHRPIPRVLFALVAVLVVAGLVVTVWQLGGFQPRSDKRTVVAPGTMLTAGPFELAFSYATAKRSTDLSGQVTWVVTVEGAGRTVGGETIAPGDAMFAARDLSSDEVQEPSGTRFGPAGLIGGPRFFTPGLPATPYAVVFHFTQAYVPGQPLRFVVVDQEYSDPNNLGHEEKVWRNADELWVMELPVRLLAEDA